MHNGGEGGNDVFVTFEVVCVVSWRGTLFTHQSISILRDTVIYFGSSGTAPNFNIEYVSWSSKAIPMRVCLNSL